MYLSVKRIYDTGDHTRLEFTDEDKDDKPVIGFINYGDDPDRPRTGRIHDAVLDEEYRGKGVIEQMVPSILCDLKCRGAEAVTITTVSPKLGARSGFEMKLDRGLGKFKNMERDLADLQCACKLSVKKLLPEKVPEKAPIQFERT